MVAVSNKAEGTCVDFSGITIRAQRPTVVTPSKWDRRAGHSLEENYVNALIIKSHVLTELYSEILGAVTVPE